MIQRSNIGFKRLLRAVVSAVFSVVKFINQASIEHPTDGGTTICFDVDVLQKVEPPNFTVRFNGSMMALTCASSKS